MNDQDHSLSLSDPDRSLVLFHLLVNFLKNLVSCQTSFRKQNTLFPILSVFLIFTTTFKMKNTVFIGGMSLYLLYKNYIACSFKFLLKVGVEVSIVNAPLVSLHKQSKK
jgi:hypothetical protein